MIGISHTVINFWLIVSFITACTLKHVKKTTHHKFIQTSLSSVYWSSITHLDG